jgi:hypothetical protein
MERQGVEVREALERANIADTTCSERHGQESGAHAPGLASRPGYLVDGEADATSHHMLLPLRPLVIYPHRLLPPKAHSLITLSQWPLRPRVLAAPDQDSQSIPPLIVDEPAKGDQSSPKDSINTPPTADSSQISSAVLPIILASTYPLILRVSTTTLPAL